MKLPLPSFAPVVLLSSSIAVSLFTGGCYVQIHGRASNPSPGVVEAPSAPSEPVGIAIRYDHFVDGRFDGHVEFLRVDSEFQRASASTKPAAEHGTMKNTANGRTGTWTIQGDRLVMRWPTESAPGGAWVDDVVLSKDRAMYEGTNNVGSRIVGTRTSDPVVRPTLPPAPSSTDEELPLPIPGDPVEHRPDGTCWQSPLLLGSGDLRPVLVPAVQVRCPS
ncbi:MAG: hypothetical protein U0414_19910 [Polyangiaceae bacterium]